MVVATLPETDWRQVELGIQAMIQDVAGAWPRDGRGQSTLLTDTKRTYVHTAVVETRTEKRPDPWPHLATILELARRTHGYKVLAVRLTRLLNALPGVHLGDLGAEEAKAVKGQSSWFDEEFVVPLVGEGLRRAELGIQPETFAREAVTLLRALVERDGLNFRFWWLLSNLRIASDGPIPLAEGIRLRRLSVDEKADMVSDVADLGYAPSTRELQVTDWKLEIELPGGPDALLPGWPGPGAFETSRNLVERLQWALALSGSGLVQIRWRDHDPLQWSRRPWIPQNAFRPQKAALAPPFVEEQTLILDGDGILALQAIWSTIAAMGPDKDLEAILVRHARGCRQIHPLDRARDLVSCLERAFLDNETKGKGQKLALRVAAFLHPPGAEAREAREYMARLYQFRNEDLHDAEAPGTTDLQTITGIARAAVLRILTLSVSQPIAAGELRRQVATFAASPAAGRGRFEPA